MLQGDTAAISFGRGTGGSRSLPLTRGEQQRLLTFGKQEAMLLAGNRRVILTIQASEVEHAMMTTNPVELAERPPASLPPVASPIQDHLAQEALARVSSADVKGGTRS